MRGKKKSLQEERKGALEHHLFPKRIFSGLQLKNKWNEIKTINIEKNIQIK